MGSRMIRAAIFGRLGGDPVERTTKTGKSMVTASVAVAVGRPGEDISAWISLVGFGAAAAALSAHQKGDVLSATGVLTKSTFTSRDGVERTTWSLLVEQAISARTAGPAKGRRESPSRSPSRTSRRRDSAGAPSLLPDDPLDDLWPPDRIRELAR
jgi:single-strand DNA-binding protein